MTAKTKVCPECNAEVHGRASAAIYCSAECRTAVNRRKSKALLKERLRSAHEAKVFICELCGEQYFPSYGRQANGGRRFCSQKCQRRANSTRNHRHGASRYKLSIPEYNALLLGQDNRCAICLQPFAGRARDKAAPQIDHDHRTGVVRGVLCRPCNTALGNLGDDVTVLDRAITYLKRAADQRQIPH